MARIARVVAPGVPHHVTQQGNRRMDVFFSDDDRRAYLSLLREFGKEHGVEYWAYCLLPNHVHLIAVPKREESLALGIGGAHQAYTRRINLREGWRGYLWQGRFASCPMDEDYLLAAARYVERNPVRARLSRCAWEYRWSSARAHVEGKDDGLVKVKPLLKRVEDWKEFLRLPEDEATRETLRLHERTGRPLGSEKFIARIERIAGRLLHKLKPGPKKRK